MKKILWVIIVILALVLAYLYLDQQNQIPEEVVDVVEQVENNLPEVTDLPFVEEEIPEEPEEQINITKEDIINITENDTINITEENKTNITKEDIINITTEPVINETQNKTPKKIVAFGDSLTEGFGIPVEDNYPSQLQRKLNETGNSHYTVVNQGVSGETSWQAKARLQNVIDEDPDVVILVIGANDAFNLFDPEVTKQNINDMVTELQNNNITVILGGMQVLGTLSTDQAVEILMKQLGVPKEYAQAVYAGMNYVENFNRIYPESNEELNIFYIPFFLEGVAGIPSLNIEDGIHPTKEGYTIILENNLWPVLEPLLE